jgi:hypothetical protein
MIMPIFDIPDKLLSGRRAIEGIKGIKIIEDWSWYDEKNLWVLKCVITIKDIHPLVPNKTSWYILCDPSYPEGNIEFYPAKYDSITTTFQHQSHNSEGSQELPWCTGNICLHSEFYHIGQLGVTDEPLNDPNLRLKWRFERAQAWLEMAAQNKLIKLGDPYELPDVPFRRY